jgi:TetR/AcrR family transcriptional repressor of lmrAB and yxaGH operons
MGESDTRQRVVEAASALFQANGYRGTSWRALVKASGTPWGSIQHHFPGGKEELGVAAVAHGAELLGGFVAGIFDNSPTPADAVRAWYGASATLLAAGDFGNGCPIAAVALDTDAGTAALGDACAAAFTGFTRIVATRLRGAGFADADALAVTIVAAFEGALMLSRSQRDVTPLGQAAEQMCRLLAASTPASAR